MSHTCLPRWVSTKFHISQLFILYLYQYLTDGGEDHLRNINETLPDSRTGSGFRRISWSSFDIPRLIKQGLLLVREQILYEIHYIRNSVKKAPGTQIDPINRAACHGGCRLSIKVSTPRDLIYHSWISGNLEKITINTNIAYVAWSSCSILLYEHTPVSDYTKNVLRLPGDSTTTTQWCVSVHVCSLF